MSSHTTNDCPTAEELLHFSQGKPTLFHGESVGIHLDRCKPCRERLKSFSEETTPKIGEKASQLAETNAIKPEPFQRDRDNSESPSFGMGDTRSFVPTRDVSGDEPASAELGPYRLIEKLGEGGMGSVYLAEQMHPVQRRVALKIIRAGRGCEEIIARFEAEKQTLAMMDHPSIARVYDAGVADDTPYFAMELVQGQTLIQYCDSHQLSLEKRLRLMVSLCRAFSHAHQRGIVHRDIKPSNVLVSEVDGELVPKVIDFGVAKALDKKLTEETLATEVGQLMGTPQYMSPEQARMNPDEITAKSDIYSLGVLMYELVCGKRPIDAERFQSGDWMEILRIIREEDSPRPSMKLAQLGSDLARIAAARDMDSRELVAAVRGDLDWIVLKALEKEPERRYANANQLAEDIENHLNHRPVIAAAPSVSYRLEKFARRNRNSLRWCAAIGGVLLIAAALSWWLLGRASNADKQSLETAVAALSTATGASIKPAIADLRELPEDRVLSTLRLQYATAVAPRKLPLACALADYGEVDAAFLVEQIRLADAADAPNIIAALKNDSEKSHTEIQRALETMEKGNWKHKARLAIVAWMLGDANVAEEMVYLQSDPSQRTEFIAQLVTWRDDSSALLSVAKNIEHRDLRSACSLAVGGMSNSAFTPQQLEAWVEQLQNWYEFDPSPGVHSAARWALAQHNIALPALKNRDVSEGVDWYELSNGITMLQFGPGEFRMKNDSGLVFPIPKPNHVKIQYAFFISDAEITSAQFAQFWEDKSYAEAKPKSCPQLASSQEPLHRSNWFDAIQFCNWLSAAQGLELCYAYQGKTRELSDGLNLVVVEDWRLIPGANGYRLPTEEEWEYACRAKTTTRFPWGNSVGHTNTYGVFNTDSIAEVRSRMPNGWGMFDMLGNTTEWCGDIQPAEGAELLHRNEVICRGGSHEHDALSSGARISSLPDKRYYGFRVARNSPISNQKD